MFKAPQPVRDGRAGVPRRLSEVLVRLRPVLAALLLAAVACLSSGCGALPLLAVGDVLGVAETGKTGYDMATGLNERRRLSLDHGPEVQAEARLRAVLDSLGGSLKYAVPVVTGDRAYVLGTYASQEELDRARRATRNIRGVRETILCLYPAGSGRDVPVTDGEIRDNILRMAGLRTRDVRVHVVEGNAVLMGSVRSPSERARINASARDAGAKAVRDFLILASR
jgi:hypothetical protein